MNPTPASTSAFPYTNPYTNPYTQRRTQSASSSSSQSPQQQLEQSLQILVRSRVVPPSQTIEQLFDLLQKSNEHKQSSSTSSTSTCWTLSMAESLAVYVTRIFGCHKNINMTGRNPEGYPSTLCFLARCMEQWLEDDSIMYAIAVKELEVEVEEHSTTTTTITSSSSQTRTLQMSLLQVLHKLAVNFDDPIVQNPAMMGLSIMWSYLDRISFLTSWKYHQSVPSSSRDSAWWMPAPDDKRLADIALRQLMSEERSEYPKTYMFPNSTELRVVRTSILVCLLKHDRAAWLHEHLSQDKSFLSNFSRHLMGDINRLSDPGLATKHAVHLSIASFALFSLMDSKQELDLSNEFNQLVSSSKVIESFFRSYFGIFGASSPNGPRWTYEHKDASTQRWMEECIYVWSLCKDSETCKLAIDAVERHWRLPIEEFWASLLNESESYSRSSQGDKNRGTKQDKDLFSRLFLLYSIHHESIRQILVEGMAKSSGSNSSSLDFLVGASRNLMQSLLFHLNQDSALSVSLHAASLLRSLLSDKASTSSHDEMSRSLWKVVDPGIVQRLIQKAVKLASPEGDLAHRPLLLCVLDIIDLTLSTDDMLQQVIHMIDTESLEALIHLMVPKDIRIDQAGAFMDTSREASYGDGDTDTPPVNNLSRFDEASICIEKEEEAKPVGLDNYIRLSVAALLARFGYLDLDNPNIDTTNEFHDHRNGLRLMQSRIRTTVADFISNSLSKSNGQQQSPLLSIWNEATSSSIELTRRRFRLLVAMAVPENEEFLSSYLFSKEKDHENLVYTLKVKIEKGNERIQAATHRENHLENEKSTLRGAIDSQSVRFWREINRVKKSAAEQTQSKVAIFEAERKMAEHRAHGLAKRLTEAEHRVNEADQCAKESHEAEVRARQELQDTLTRLKSKEEEAEELKRTLGKREATISQLQDESESAKDTLANIKADNGRLQQLLNDREADIAELQESRDTMEQNLDCLFGDLVKLCHMYEAKEKTEAELHSQNGSLSRKLREERSKGEANTQELRREKENIQNQNEKLEQKLAKYREKLESERRKVKELEAKKKNYGPVSYINNLHDSVNSSVNASKHDKSQKKSSSSRTLKSRGKENDIDSSSRGKASDNFYFSSQKASSSSCLRRPYR